MKKYLILGFLFCMITSCMDMNDDYQFSSALPAEVASWAALADSSATAFIDNYWDDSEKCFFDKIDRTHIFNAYWPQAHALDLLIDIYLRTGDQNIKQYIYDAHEGIYQKNYDNSRGPFYNNYYDDMAWHGLAQLRVLEEIDGSWINYEESARDLWEWLTEGWTDHDGGGIQWRHEGPQDEYEKTISKGIPANGPACIIAARRAVKYPDEVINGYTSLEWAHRIYDWMKYNRIVLATGRVFEIENNTDNDYSYDIGTFIGSAIELYNITKDYIYLNDAIKVADYHINNNIDTSTRVMKDFGEQIGENGGGYDCNLFKGIFARYFTILIQHPDLPEDARTRFSKFMETNGKYLWYMGTQKEPILMHSPTWYEQPGPTDIWGDLMSGISGATMMEAMAVLEKGGYLK